MHPESTKWVASSHTLCVTMLVLAPWCACGQSALVETVTMTTAREAVRVYVQEIRLDSGVPSPAAALLPGVAPAGPLLSGGGGTVVAAVATSGRGPAASLVGIGPAYAGPGPDGWRALRGAGPFIAGAMPGSDAAPPRVVVMSGINEGPVAGRGRIDVWPLAVGPPVAFAEAPAEWLLPGAPAAAVTHPSAGWVAVLCRTPSGAHVLHVRDTARGRVVREQAPLARPSERIEGAALALAPDGSVLFAMLNDAAADDTGDGRCWVAPLDTVGFVPIGNPIELPGTAERSSAFAFTEGGALWIATRSPSAGFAYVHRLDLDSGQYVIGARRSYTGLSRPLVMAANGRTTAIGVDHRVEIVDGDAPEGGALSFSAPVAALAWWEKTLLVAEANRVHAVTPDRRESWSIALQTGQIASLLPLPMPAEPGRFTDSDGDQLADAIDPEPDTPSPRLDVPFAIALREDAAGNEVRAVRIAPEHAGASNWSALTGRGATPWLRVFPPMGRGPAWFIVGADPSQLGPGVAARGSVAVTLAGVDEYATAAGSPRRIAVYLEPRSAVGQSVLWLLGGRGNGPRDGRDTVGFGKLASVLAGPPHYWSHAHAQGGALEAVDAYAVVVLDTDAITAGLVNRQALLDYVARGGGLLVIARDRGGNTVERWLAPAGIVIGAGSAGSDAMDAVASHPVTRHWTPSTVPGAASIAPDPALTVLVASKDVTGTAVRSFGRGRIAVLASPAPLESVAMAAYTNRLFACDLFDWLARAAIETQDLDGDALADALEDRNGNGVVDPGETGKLDPDSDGDGVPDGKEDANANGAVDDGETNPLDRDSDADGDWDGADVDPLVGGGRAE